MNLRSKSNPWPISPRRLAQQRDDLRRRMRQNRAATLTLFEALDAKTFCQQAHADFSPVGWHLGHIGYTESLWLLEYLDQQTTASKEYRQLFAADGLPKTERQNLPDKSTIIAYLAEIRGRVEAILDVADISKHTRLWEFVLQHESQHCETISIVLAQLGKAWPNHNNSGLCHGAKSMELIPAGPFQQGSDSHTALDNERPPHTAWLSNYWIDSAPVSQAAYQTFMTAGGYEKAQYWSEAGWQWCQQQTIQRPEYWQPQSPDRPVSGVSWYEAEAYSNFVGKRLPTESEWEKAAQTLCWKTPGSVWEWTNSWFAGYTGFTAYPYQGYSAAYFDNAHRVLRGGSHATRSNAVRPSFRNWYHPWTRVIFAGFRCASDTPP